MRNKHDHGGKETCACRFPGSTWRRALTYFKAVAYSCGKKDEVINFTNIVTTWCFKGDQLVDTYLNLLLILTYF